MYLRLQEYMYILSLSKVSECFLDWATKQLTVAGCKIYSINLTGSAFVASHYILLLNFSFL